MEEGEREKGRPMVFHGYNGLFCRAAMSGTLPWEGEETETLTAYLPLTVCYQQSLCSLLPWKSLVAILSTTTSFNFLAYNATNNHCLLLSPAACTCTYMYSANNGHFVLLETTCGYIKYHNPTGLPIKWKMCYIHQQSLFFPFPWKFPVVILSTTAPFYLLVYTYGDIFFPTGNA